MQDRKTQQQVPISSEGCPLGIMYFSLAVAKSSSQLQDNHLFLSALYKKVMSIIQMPSSWVPQLTHTRVCHSSFISFIYVLCCMKHFGIIDSGILLTWTLGLNCFKLVDVPIAHWWLPMQVFILQKCYWGFFLWKWVFGKKTKQRKK